MSKTKPQQYSAERTEQLLHAAAEGDALAVEALLGAGAYINGTNYNLQTPLIRAAFLGHVEVVKVLLDHGAEVDAKDKLGLTAFEWSIKRGFPEVAQLLPASAASMANTLETPPQPELAGITTIPDTEERGHETQPEQSEDPAARLDGTPTQPLLYTAAFNRERERQQANLDETPELTRDEFAQTLDDPPTRPLGELPTQRLYDPPTRPLDRFATQLLDDPPTRPLGEFATQQPGEHPTQTLGEPPIQAQAVASEPLPTTAPLGQGTTSSEGMPTSKPARASRKLLTWVILAVTALVGILAAYLIINRGPVEPTPEAAVTNKAPVPAGAFAGSEVSLQLGKAQPARSPETTTSNPGTSGETPGVETYPLVNGAIKGSEISLPDLESPAGARRGWSKGLINVAVTVGSDGKVITARPLNGPWLWRKAAESAAQKAQFKPQQDASPRSGTITYHFGPLGQS
ncbi:MAG: ankyrin repeat domain-containing protein [Pyrinomonadaceae bacterium]